MLDFAYQKQYELAQQVQKEEKEKQKKTVKTRQPPVPVRPASTRGAGLQLTPSTKTVQHVPKPKTAVDTLLFQRSRWFKKPGGVSSKPVSSLSFTVEKAGGQAEKTIEYHSGRAVGGTGAVVDTLMRQRMQWARGLKPEPPSPIVVEEKERQRFKQQLQEAKEEAVEEFETQLSEAKEEARREYQTQLSLAGEEAWKEFNVLLKEYESRAREAGVSEAEISAWKAEQVSRFFGWLAGWKSSKLREYTSYLEGWAEAKRRLFSEQLAEWEQKQTELFERWLQGRLEGWGESYEYSPLSFTVGAAGKEVWKAIEYHAGNLSEVLGLSPSEQAVMALRERYGRPVSIWAFTLENISSGAPSVEPGYSLSKPPSPYIPSGYKMTHDIYRYGLPDPYDIALAQYMAWNVPVYRTPPPPKLPGLWLMYTGAWLRRMGRLELSRATGVPIDWSWIEMYVGGHPRTLWATSYALATRQTEKLLTGSAKLVGGHLLGATGAMVHQATFEWLLDIPKLPVWEPLRKLVRGDVAAAAKGFGEIAEETGRSYVESPLTFWGGVAGGVLFGELTGKLIEEYAGPKWVEYGEIPEAKYVQVIPDEEGLTIWAWEKGRLKPWRTFRSKDIPPQYRVYLKGIEHELFGVGEHTSDWLKRFEARGYASSDIAYSQIERYLFRSGLFKRGGSYRSLTGFTLKGEKALDLLSRLAEKTERGAAQTAIDRLVTNMGLMIRDTIETVSMRPAYPGPFEIDRFLMSRLGSVTKMIEKATQAPAKTLVAPAESTGLASVGAAIGGLMTGLQLKTGGEATAGTGASSAFGKYTSSIAFQEPEIPAGSFDIPLLEDIERYMLKPPPSRVETVEPPRVKPFLDFELPRFIKPYQPQRIKPKQKSATKPIIAPITMPEVKPVLKPVIEPRITPIEQPKVTPKTVSIEQPVAIPSIENILKHLTGPIEIPVEAPIEAPVEVPIPVSVQAVPPAPQIIIPKPRRPPEPPLFRPRKKGRRGWEYWELYYTFAMPGKVAKALGLRLPAKRRSRRKPKRSKRKRRKR